MINNSWCSNANVVTLARSCSPNLELLALKFCSFYLPREFTSAIVNTVYIPPQVTLHCVNFMRLAHSFRLKRETLVQRDVVHWTDQSVAALQDALDNADWDMFRCSTDDVSEYTEAVVGFIGKLEDDTIPRATIKTFPNQKPWVDKTIREALNSRTAAYNVGIISGNMDEYKSAAYGGCRAVREAKWCYGKKLESEFQQSGSRSLWQGLRMIMDYRSPPPGLMSADESLAKKLNTFFTRFEAASSSAIANSTRANNANGGIGAANNACVEPTRGQRPLIIMESDVRRVFQRQNTRKVAGPDGICGKVLKACADQLAPVFPDIFNLSLTQGISQLVWVDNCVSCTLTLSTGAPRGCVLSPLLYSLYTYDCVATSSSTTIVKFADDTVIMGLISDNNERAYLEEIKHLENWCQENDLLLNVSKTKEMIVDCSKKQERHYL
ncbi:hypothetical protein P4O66_012386 [Electrophorus voltai]|uniref:Reverse transcriptase domain-containing protein n=1 Tax=Electrophorus voltai TaxID=2609070 RepID=A0AAD9DUS1_9TELE|nr:hypothetical protein P4O66_012386 [Electrophorus voltai]